MLELSRKAGGIAQSEIRIMSVECERVRGINLAQGICDTEVPEPVQRKTIEAIRSGQNSYTRLDGVAQLRRAIAGKMREYNHVEVDPEREIVVTAGSTGAFYSACMALLNPGDEVIVFEPYYGYHVNTLRALDCIPVYVTMHPPRWLFSREHLEQAVTVKTRAIILNSPANPSGKVFSQEELEFIADLAIRHDLFVITDEIYEYFLYDGNQHISPASLPGMADRTITISGFSKTYSITGWRIGYAVCNERWAQPIGYFHDLAYICAPSPFQHGVTAGLEELTNDFYVKLADEYRSKRDLLCTTLEQVGLSPSWPQGSYYVLADASSLNGGNSKEKAMHLLSQTGVASVPGEAFFSGGGRNLLRFCFAKTDTDLEEACRRLSKMSVETTL
ncbi:MAG TPA: pyridoxal phosphate-dependent aminotransferase [Terriglobales bacterium]|nr:pyridoxal phosphate-dependent aminotransferase [Terriglobales bacterium]